MVVKATAGMDAPERCAQAFTVAAAAVAAGVPTSLWLTGEAVRLALPGTAASFDLAHSPDLAEILDLLLAEGSVTVCTQCADRRAIAGTDLIPGVRVAGASTFVAEVMTDGTQALVY